MGKCIGIDLGTTNSAVAVQVANQVRIINNIEGEALTPSIVNFRQGGFITGEPRRVEETVVGKSALYRLITEPETTISSTKKLIGRRFNDKEVQKIIKNVSYKIDYSMFGVSIKIHESEHSPVSVMAEIFEKLKKDTEYSLNDKIEGAVITVPVGFNEAQRNATREAGIKAGLNVLKILDEPTASAISFAFNKTEFTEPQILLVFDMGGGKLEVSIMGIQSEQAFPIAVAGDTDFGGDDFDQVIADKIIHDIKALYKINPLQCTKLLARIQQEARIAKEILSFEHCTNVFINEIFEKDIYIFYDKKIYRDVFNSWIEPLLDYCDEIIDNALKKVSFWDESSNSPFADNINYVILTGNSTLIPALRERLNKRFGDKVNYHPKYGVAEGAAIIAKMINEGKIKCPRCINEIDKKDEDFSNTIGFDKKICNFRLKDKTTTADRIPVPIAYGFQTDKDEFKVIIEEGDFYPTLPEEIKTTAFYTSRPNQRIITIPIYGVINFTKSSAYEKQGEICAILPPGLPQQTAVFIRLWLDGHGVFMVDCKVTHQNYLPCIVMRGGEDKMAVDKYLEVNQILDEIRSSAVLPVEKIMELSVKIESGMCYIENTEYNKAIDYFNNLISEMLK